MRRTSRDALSGLRLAAARAPPRARTPDHRPCRLRRLLRHDRKARRSLACRQAGDRRRRKTRRGGGLLLRGAHLRHPLGDADVRGQAPLPAGRRGQAEHGEIREGRARGAPRHARADAAGRAAVDRRGLSRSDRHRAAARHERGARCWRALRARSSATSASRFRSGCRPTSSSPRSPPTWTSRAASPCSGRTRPRRFWRRSRSASSMASAP